MLSLSRIPPKQHSEVFRSPNPEEALTATAQAKVAQRLVTALQQGGMAAAALDTLSFATLAANERFRILAARPVAERELKAALRSAGPGANGLVWRGDDGSPHVVRCFGIDGCATSVTLVTVSDPREEEVLRFADFVQRHGVTRAEAKVLWRLLAGDALTDIASALAVSLPTVKSQLRSLLAKAGVSRQAALIAHYYSAGTRAATLPDDVAPARSRIRRRRC